MKLRAFLILLFLCLSSASNAFAVEVDYLDFVNLEINLFEFVYLGAEIDGGSGVVLDFNTGPFVWHVGARVHYWSTLGVYGEAGVGYVLFGSYETNAPYTQVFLINSTTVGNVRYDEYEIIKGTCPAVWLHMVEAGIRPFYLTYNDDILNYSSEFADFMLYAGYRFASYYGEIIPAEEIDVHAHAIAGFTNRHVDDDGFITNDQGRILPGFELGAKWHMFTMDFGYYDDELYIHIAWRLAITFM
ncbi:MAG: hypothetical protein JW904_13095 [Spirochaetales bacterium]|nr:hypothetical protein [Spirochaetales bacterium]